MNRMFRFFFNDFGVFYFFIFTDHAAFDNPIVLNWFFIFGHSCDGMITTIFTVWALYYASKLKKAIAPALVECQKGDPMLLFAAKVWLLLLPEKLFSD